MQKRLKIALVHDHLAQDGGAEKVLKVLKEIYPKAPIFTLIFDPKNTNHYFSGQEIHTSFLQKMPLGVPRYQWWVGRLRRAAASPRALVKRLVLNVKGKEGCAASPILSLGPYPQSSPAPSVRVQVKLLKSLAQNVRVRDALVVPKSYLLKSPPGWKPDTA